MMKQKLSSRILSLFKCHIFLKTVARVIGKKWRKNDYTTFEGINKAASWEMNYKFDCRYPVTFNEKLSWLKLGYHNDLWEICADKVKVKDFLERQGLGKYVPKTFGIYRNSSQINLEKLPEKFVLKANHDSGSVFVCNKGKTNFQEVFRKLDESIKNNYCSHTGEWVYNNIEPLIFAEELLERPEGETFDEGLMDWKLFFFNGKFGWGYVSSNRFTDAKFNVFEDGFVYQDVCYIHLNSKKKPPKPEHYEEMLEIGAKISAILDFARVDFYETKDGLKIGELTFFTHSGQGPFSKKEYDYKYGKLFDYCRLSQLFPKRERNK